jgi:small redox-active disulfide protein 2
MLTIKILGPGCSNCKTLEAVARQAVENTGVEAQFIKVTNMPDILAYDILSTPGLVINEKVVCSGRIPSPAQVSTWLADAELAAA